MQVTSSAFDAVMLLPDQTVAQRILLNLPAFQVDGVTAIPSSYADVSDCVISIQGDLGVTSTAPEGALLIDATSAMTGELVLSGPLNQAAGVQKKDSQTIFWLFNPHDATSPLYRLPQYRTNMTVTLQEGRWVGGNTPEYVTVGTLIVDTVACSNGTVTLTLIDGRNSVRGAAMLPPVVTQAPYNAQLTNEFAIDYMLRHSSPGQYLSWPMRHPNCKFAAGYRSSIWPEVGNLYPGFTQQPVFGAGLYGTGLSSSAFLIVNQPATPFLTTDKICLHMLNQGLNFAVNINDDPNVYQLVFQRISNTLFLYSVTPSGQTVQSWTITAGPHELEYSVAWAGSSTSVTGTVWVDGSPNSVSFTAKDARPSGRNFSIIAAGGNLEGLQFTNETSYATYYPFDRTLILDPGQSLNPLTALPDVTGQDVWPVLQQIAASEAAVINLDELNVCNFTNRNTIAATQSTLTVSSQINLTGLDSLEQMSTVATHVQVPVNQVSISIPETVWGANSVIVVEPGTPTVLYVQTDNEVLNIATTDSGFFPGGAFGGSAVLGKTYWQGCRTTDGLGAPVTSGISISIVQLSAKLLKVTITNSTSLGVALVTPSGGYSGTIGQPALNIGGQQVVTASVAPDGSNMAGAIIADAQWPPASVGGSITNQEYGDVLLAIPANDWLQDTGTGQTLASHYLSDFHVPKPLIRNATMISDPRVQLLDVVTLQDPDVSQIAGLDCLVIGIHFQLGGGTGAGQFWTRSLDLRAMWPPGAWVLGRAGMSELGSTTYAY